MNLVETPTKAPPDAIVSPVAASDKVVLRTARWMSTRHSDPCPGTVLICTGRSEFIEKYYEVIADLRARGFAVAVFDWRGQGLSNRLLRNPQKGHVGAFADYDRDLAAVVRQILEPFCPRPWYGLAHSMGGAIALHHAADHPEVFDRIVLTAPMIDLAGLRWPNLARVAADVVCRLGLGRGFVPVITRHTRALSTFDGNVLTSDQRRFDRTAAIVAANTALGLGAPTVRWVHAAFASMGALSDEPFAERLETPTLFVLAGDDVVVDGRAAERLSARLRASTVVTIRGARHEVMMERDALREQFWAAFDAFVPHDLDDRRRSPSQPAVRLPHGTSVA